MRRRFVRLTAHVVATVVLCATFVLRVATASDLSAADLEATANAVEPPGQHVANTDVEYGPHGGVIGLPAGSYVCVVYDARRRSCLVRAITEAEINYAVAADGDPNGPPGWMRASLDLAVSAAAIGLPVDNVYQLPGLMTDNLSANQVAMVRCLANSGLGRALPQWDDASIYRNGIIERCAAENEFEGGTPSLPSPVLPLAARHIQEAVLIVIVAQQLATANATYFEYAGRYAGHAGELISGALLPAMPASTPLMTARGYVVERGNRIVVDLRAQGTDVCRALNLIHGRPWAALPGAFPAGYRAGCYPSGGGYRFEFRP
jgi:hypothetical protein